MFVHTDDYQALFNIQMHHFKGLFSPNNVNYNDPLESLQLLHTISTYETCFDEAFNAPETRKH